MRDLENRVCKLEKALSEFSEELRLALRYVGPDAASSLTKSRVVLEKLLLLVYRGEMGQEPRKPLLGDILNDNQFTRKLERRILSRMNAIRDMGNLGPHGESVEPSDAARVLDDLCEVLDWYLQRYMGSKARVAQGPTNLNPLVTEQSLLTTWSLRYVGDAALLTLPLDFGPKEEMEQQTNELLSIMTEGNLRKVVISLEHHRFFNSGLFIPLFRILGFLRKNGGRLRLCNLSTTVDEVFRFQRFDHIFEIVADWDSALREWA